MKTMDMVSANPGRLAVNIVNGRVSPVGEIDVLFVNTYEKSGGAARAAYRIFSEVRNRSAKAHYLTLTKESSSTGTSGRIHRSILGAIVRALTRLNGIPLYFYPQRPQGTFTPNFWPNPLRIRLAQFKTKLVHLHWVGAGLLGIEELAQLTCPIVWTLHDAWAFTGGCHYTGDCEGFKQLCGCCPQLGSQRDDDYSRTLMRKKTKVFEKLDLTVVTPSRWLAQMARQSNLFARRRIEVIPNGLDTETFKPVHQHTAREGIGIQPDGPVLLFGAQVLTDPRKGWDLLCAALRRLNRPCTVMVFGKGNVCVENASHITVHRLGNFADDASLARIYSAADVYVCPSREDNLPNTVAEALACGTPCVAFAVNGLTDMIEHKVNGWLASPFDPADLAEGISWLLQCPEPDRLRHAAREKAVTEYSIAVMGDRYMALYEDVWRTMKDRGGRVDVGTR
jgi:glycosyltransferase involved in cell wall biosynthesis